MLSLHGLSYYIGGRTIYEKASLFVRPNDKIGLIGLNGRGKSTLLKIIHGDYRPNEGEINREKDCTIGFLNQDLLSYQTDDSILTVAMGAFRAAIDTQAEIDALLLQLERAYSDERIEKLAALQERFDGLGGYTMQARAEEALEGIGFSTADLGRPLKEFSGGWRMRVMLAKLLLEQPALLMLDEPTNHLDLPSIEWMEKYLKNYPGAVIVVSHDRWFLDRVTSKTVEVTQQQLITYEGNYSFYLKEKELRDSIQQNAYENQQKNIRQTERFIERFRAKATKARQVQSRVKALERLERIDEVAQDVAEINFRFTFDKPSGRQVASLNSISKSYGSIVLFGNASAQVERGDKIALIGANGKGKSTLLRLISGSEAPDSGEQTLGYNVTTGFYAQHQLEALHRENEVLEELKQAGSRNTEQELRNILGCFLFSDEDVFKKIKVLSGGEKSRVALAKTLISDANFLILDEPTNHLDFISENILIQALQQYAGSFITVSHNRYFVEQVANKIWYIEDGQIKEYPGSYAEYEHKLSLENRGATKPEVKVSKPSAAPDQKAAPKAEDKELKRLHKELQEVEERLETAQARQAATEAAMARQEAVESPARMADLQKEWQQAAAEASKLFETWEKLMTSMETQNKKG